MTEDLAAQEAAHVRAHEDLDYALETLAARAKTAARAVRSASRRRARVPREVMDDVHAAAHQVRAAEDTAELAALDLSTAAGGDA